jgi:hypothetical protein
VQQNVAVEAYQATLQCEDRERSGLETLANILPRLPDCDTYYFEDLFKMVLNVVKADPG